jgi:hypothetical protein
MSKIYISSTGEYSDWSIHAVFSSREKAEAYQLLVRDALSEEERKYYGQRFNDILEFELGEPLIQHEQGYVRCTIQMYSDGAVEYAKESSIADYWNGTRWSFGQRRHPAGGHSWVLNANIWARDLVHAIKTVNERRLVVIAEDKWGNDAWLEEVTRG